MPPRVQAVNGSASHTGALFAARLPSTLSLGTELMTLTGRTAHTSPQPPGNIGSFRLSKRRWHRDRSPHQFLPWSVEFWNEALRIVASAHIPTGKLQWKRRHVSARNPAANNAGLRLLQHSRTLQAG